MGWDGIWLMLISSKRAYGDSKERRQSTEQKTIIFLHLSHPAGHRLMPLWAIFCKTVLAILNYEAILPLVLGQITILSPVRHVRYQRVHWMLFIWATWWVPHVGIEPRLGPRDPSGPLQRRSPSAASVRVTGCVVWVAWPSGWPWSLLPSAWGNIQRSM